MNAAPPPTADPTRLPIVVQKYGGSSVATLDKMRHVAERIAATVREGKRVCAVVSAMGKTTDQLLSQARALSDRPNARELDMLLSTGERVSVALLAIALGDLGIQAVSFTGSQSGIITNTRHNRARIVEVRPFRLMDELDAGKVILVAGYQGVSYAREITTLGRGGTDTTAVALAAALGAEYCEICSDVDGVYTADPREVPSATRLDSLSHQEMVSLARAGSRVLNQDCVEYATRHGVAIFAKSTHAPRDDRGTIIRTNPSPEPRALTALAHRAELLIARAPNATPAALLAFLAEYNALPHALLGGPAQSAIAHIAPENCHHRKALATAIQAHFGPEASLDDTMGTITLVGPGLGERPEIVLEAERIVESHAGPNTIHLGPLELTFVLPKDTISDTLRALHDAFFGPARAS